MVRFNFKFQRFLLAVLLLILTKLSTSFIQGLDVGPETVKIYAAAVARAKTILWNGYAQFI